MKTTPWININQVSPKQMSIFNSSVAKKKKEDEPKKKSDEIELEDVQKREQPHPELIPTESEPTLSQAEWEPETVEAGFIYPAEMTNEVQAYKQGKVCFMTKKTPFSVYVEIDHFLHEPICGDITQNTFEFQDLDIQKAPEMDTKLLHTTTYSHEQPECRLICSDIHEIIFFTNNGEQHKRNLYKTTVVPLHEIEKAETEVSKGPFLHLRVPVVLGEYKIEVSLEESIEFREEVMSIKEISKEIILTNFKLVPTVFSPSTNGTRAVLKGNLWIEGYIAQKIEYTSFQNRSSVSPMAHLEQKIVAELIVHILQIQKVRVKK
jgi:hypothetical protein